MAGKTVGIVQSCYVPWKGYFDLVNSVDEFILYDDRQFTRRDWRNRNRIKTRDGSRWLTVPVHSRGLYEQRIDETLISDSGWADVHWKTIVHSYAAAPYFAEYRDQIEEAYRAVAGERRLSLVNRRLLETFADILGIRTRLSWSTDYHVDGTKTDRLVALCEAAGATDYLSGPRAREYLEEEQFEQNGIRLTYFDYDDYPEYEQLYPPFEHTVSIVDLVLNTGPDAPRFLKSFAPAVSLHGP
jgi:hypothetical protein